MWEGKSIRCVKYVNKRVVKKSMYLRSKRFFPKSILGFKTPRPLGYRARSQGPQIGECELCHPGCEEFKKYQTMLVGMSLHHSIG